jgi:hypothetical protein
VGCSASVSGAAAAAPDRQREFWRALGERSQWIRLEFKRLATCFAMMPDGAV